MPQRPYGPVSGRPDDLFARTPAPSRCPECNGRHVQPYHVVMDTFEQADCCWQCVGCGLVLETSRIGTKPRITHTGVRRPVVLPHGVDSFRQRHEVGPRAERSP